MSLVQDRLLDLLTSSPVRYHCATDAPPLSGDYKEKDDDDDQGGDDYGNGDDENDDYGELISIRCKPIGGIQALFGIHAKHKLAYSESY